MLNIILSTMLPDLEALGVDELDHTARRRILDTLPRLEDALRHVDLGTLGEEEDCDCHHDDDSDLQDEIDSLEDDVFELEEERDKLKRKLRAIRRDCKTLVDAIATSARDFETPRGRIDCAGLSFGQGRVFVLVNGRKERLSRVMKAPKVDGGAE